MFPQWWDVLSGSYRVQSEKGSSVPAYLRLSPDLLSGESPERNRDANPSVSLTPGSDDGGDDPMRGLSSNVYLNPGIQRASPMTRSFPSKSRTTEVSTLVLDLLGDAGDLEDDNSGGDKIFGDSCPETRGGLGLNSPVNSGEVNGPVASGTSDLGTSAQGVTDLAGGACFSSPSPAHTRRGREETGGRREYFDISGAGVLVKVVEMMMLQAQRNSMTVMKLGHR